MNGSPRARSSSGRASRRTLRTRLPSSAPTSPRTSRASSCTCRAGSSCSSSRRAAEPKDGVATLNRLVATLTTSAARSRSVWPLWAGLAVLAAVGATLLLTAFAGSPAHLADGVHVAGVDVGGLTPKEARKLLERRFEDVQRTPIRFVAGGRSFRLMAVQLGIQPDFADAVEAARREGDGFGPLRGY